MSIIQKKEDAQSRFETAYSFGQKEGDMKAVILCIGSEKICGDSLGPIVGSKLTAKYGVDAYVYGTVERPINRQNLKEYLSHVEENHKGSKIIAVDAALGAKEDIGVIKVVEGGLYPGGVAKKEEKVGDIGIMGIVNNYEKNFLKQLLNVEMAFVENMAEKIALALKMCV